MEQRGELLELSCQSSWNQWILNDAEQHHSTRQAIQIDKSRLLSNQPFYYIGFTSLNESLRLEKRPNVWFSKVALQTMKWLSENEKKSSDYEFCFVYGKQGVFFKDTHVRFMFLLFSPALAITEAQTSKVEGLLKEVR